MFMKLAPGCDPVCLVLELLRPQIVEVLEQVGLQQLGVDPGDTVDRVRPDHCLKMNRNKLLRRCLLRGMTAFTFELVYLMDSVVYRWFARRMRS
jgi:hypothetical protein